MFFLASYVIFSLHLFILLIHFPPFLSPHLFYLSLYLVTTSPAVSIFLSLSISLASDNVLSFPFPSLSEMPSFLHLLTMEWIAQLILAVLRFTDRIAAFAFSLSLLPSSPSLISPLRFVIQVTSGTLKNDAVNPRSP